MSSLGSVCIDESEHLSHVRETLLKCYKYNLQQQLSDRMRAVTVFANGLKECSKYIDGRIMQCFCGWLTSESYDEHHRKGYMFPTPEKMLEMLGVVDGKLCNLSMSFAKFNWHK